MTISFTRPIIDANNPLQATTLTGINMVKKSFTKPDAPSLLGKITQVALRILMVPIGAVLTVAGLPLFALGVAYRFAMPRQMGYEDLSPAERAIYDHFNTPAAPVPAVPVPAPAVPAPAPAVPAPAPADVPPPPAPAPAIQLPAAQPGRANLLAEINARRID